MVKRRYYNHNTAPKTEYVEERFVSIPTTSISSLIPLPPRCHLRRAAPRAAAALPLDGLAFMGAHSLTTPSAPPEASLGSCGCHSTAYTRCGPLATPPRTVSTCTGTGALPCLSLPLLGCWAIAPSLTGHSLNSSHCKGASTAAASFGLLVPSLLLPFRLSLLPLAAAAALRVSPTVRTWFGSTGGKRGVAVASKR